MRYVFRCTANRQVFNTDLKLLILSVGSRRKSGNEYTDHRTRDRVINSPTKTCCDGIVRQSADDSWLTASAALTARNVRCTQAICGCDSLGLKNSLASNSRQRVQQAAGFKIERRRSKRCVQQDPG